MTALAMIDDDSARAFVTQQSFVDGMMESLSADARHKLAGLTFPRP